MSAPSQPRGEAGSLRDMTYTGHVDVGGPAQVHELRALTISKVAVGPYNNNSYLLRCALTGEQILIDAAAEPERLLSLIGPDGISKVVTTHQHADHWAALAEVLAATGAQHGASAIDGAAIEAPLNLVIAEGDMVTVGQVSLRAVELVGHTPGSIALIYDDPDGSPHCFTGDCLFPGGVGNTWNDPERFSSLIGDVEEKIFNALPDETWIYPGHGDDTTLGAERPNLTEWRERGW